MRIHVFVSILIAVVAGLFLSRLVNDSARAEIELPPEQASTATEKPINSQRVRLVAAWFSEDQPGCLLAEFVAVEGPDRQPVVVSFPAETKSPHHRTLRQVIESSVDWRQDGVSPSRRDAHALAEFLVPRRENGLCRDCDSWSLVRLDLQDAGR